MENFINCKGYEGIYQISELGNVKSLSRYIENGNGGYFSKEKILNPTLNKSLGYLYVSLCKDSKPIKNYLHKIVAVNFLHLIPDGTNKIVVDHIDNNKLNNNLNNLQLITNRQNCSKIAKGKSNYVGVVLNRNSTFSSYIRINNIRKSLGTFNCAIEATNAYKKALSEI